MSEEVPLNAAPAGHRAGLHQLANVLADIARHVAAVDRAFDHALRERTHAVALIYPRRRASKRGLAHLRAIDRALDSIYDLDVDFTSGDLVKDLALIRFHVGNHRNALCWIPSYEFPIEHSEIRGWIRSFGRDLGLDIGLISRNHHDDGDERSRELAESVEHTQARVQALLKKEPAPPSRERTRARRGWRH